MLLEIITTVTNATLGLGAAGRAYYWALIEQMFEGLTSDLLHLDIFFIKTTMKMTKRKHIHQYTHSTRDILL